MKRSLYSLFWIFTALTLPSATLHAADEPFNSDAYKHFEQIYFRSHSMNELLENVRDKIPTADYNYIRDQLKETPNLKLPAAKITPGQVMMTSEGMTVSLKAVPGKLLQFTLNNHTLDFGKVTDPAERLKMCAAAMPKTGEKGALWNFLVPEAHAWVEKLAWPATMLMGYVATLYFGNDNQCQAIGTAIDHCHKQKRKIELNYKKMEEAYAAHIKSKAPDPKVTKKQKKKKKDDDEDDPDEDLANWIEFKNKMKKGQCPVVAPNEDLDDATADMISEVSRALQTQVTWLAHCPTDSRDRGEKCVADTEVIAKKLCMHLTINALDVIRNEKSKTEVAIPIDPMGPGSPANK